MLSPKTLQICQVFIIVDQSYLLSSCIGWIVVVFEFSKMPRLTLSLALKLANQSQYHVTDKEGGGWVHNILVMGRKKKVIFLHAYGLGASQDRYISL